MIRLHSLLVNIPVMTVEWLLMHVKIAIYTTKT